jgi:hypothetical protein
MEIKLNIKKNQPTVNGRVYDYDDLCQQINKKIDDSQCLLYGSEPTSINVHSIDSIVGVVKELLIDESSNMKISVEVLKTPMAQTLLEDGDETQLTATISGVGILGDDNKVTDYTFNSLYIVS